MNNFIYLKNFYKPSNLIIDIINKANINNIDRYTSSKIGNKVYDDKKRRDDYFFNTSECKDIDLFIFTELKEIIKKEFNIDICYREKYKIGYYCEEKKGFYNPHTDIQGGHLYRKISMVMSLSKNTDYEGGEFKFIDLNKTFKFDYGDIILFDPNLLHCVEPVIKGKRIVIIAFLFDIDGGIEKLKTCDNLKNYIPNI
jgi:hypothetical protein